MTGYGRVSSIIDFKTSYLCQVCAIFPDNFYRLQVNNSRPFFECCRMITGMNIDYQIKEDGSALQTGRSRDRFPMV
jgi:hypothetical protein